MSHEPAARPVPSFSTLSAVAVVAGVVVGVGIFRLPAVVAGHAASDLQFMLFWLAGGIVCLLGALCYAELAAIHPDAGGEYTYLHRAFGPAVGFLFAWGRMLVIQTGSIALVAYILGDYASRLIDLGTYSASIHAALAIMALTLLALAGTRHVQRLQMLVVGLLLVMLLMLSLAGLWGDVGMALPAMATERTDWLDVLFIDGAAGQAMIFVLLTYGGWNEAAYLSAELRGNRRSMLRVLVISVVLITILYWFVNLAYVRVLGLEALAHSSAPGADMAAQVFGETGADLMTGIIVLAALSTASATIITGARTNYALGRDWRLLRFMGSWRRQSNAPDHALIIQGVIALLLVAMAGWSKEAVSTIVDYTAPVFWGFMLITTASLMVFRRRGIALPYRVPLYPLLPIVFIVVCGYMLYASLVFTGMGALVGAAALLLGLPVYGLVLRHQPPSGAGGT